MVNSLFKVLGIVLIIGVFILLIGQFTGGSIPEDKPLGCYTSGTCVDVIYDIKVDKGYMADPNYASVVASLNRNIVKSIVAFDIVPNAVDVKTKITTDGEEKSTDSCRIAAEGGNCHNYLKVWYDLKTSQTISKTSRFELFDSTSGSSWGDQITCTFSISKDAVTIISGDSKCASFAGVISPSPTTVIIYPSYPAPSGYPTPQVVDCRTVGCAASQECLYAPIVNQFQCFNANPITCQTGYHYVLSSNSCEPNYGSGTYQACAAAGCPTNQICQSRDFGSGQIYLCQATLAYVCSTSNPCPRGQYCTSNNRCGITI
jgi:hypothetical protein